MKLNFKLMREPLRNAERKLFGFYIKPYLTILAIIFMANNMSAQSGAVINACGCLSNQTHSGNGQFESTLQITNGGIGVPWYIAQDSILGLYKNPSPAPPAIPEDFTTGVGGDQFTEIGGGVYELPVIHVDGQGFWVKVTDGTDTITLNIPVGHCNYPKTNIIGDPFVCEGQVSDYSTLNNAGSTYEWTLTNNGVHGGTMTTANNVNPITIEWDGNSDGNAHLLELEETASNGCVVNDQMEVVIEDTITLACNNNVQISLDANCAGVLTADMFLEDEQYNNDSYTIIIEDENGNLVKQDTLSKNMVGHTYTITVLQLCTSNMCWSHMLVLDKSAPELNCHTDTIKCSDSVDPFQLTDGFPLLYYTSITPTANTNEFLAKGTSGCSDVLLKYYDEVTEEPCSSDFTSTIVRTWIVNDLSDNLSTCVDTIRTTRTGLADIKYPKNWDGTPGNFNFIQACTYYPKDGNGNPSPTKTGEPSGPLCGNIMINYSDTRLYLCHGDNDEGGESFKVLRNWSIIDMCTGNSFDTLQIIAIMDTRKPNISISGLNHDTLFVNTEYYNCGSDVVLPVPHISDCSLGNNPDYEVGYHLTDENGDFPDPTFPYTTINKIGGKYKIPDIHRGVARVQYTATDPCGNFRQKIIFIKVIDNLAPQAVCDKHTSITLSDEGIAYLEKYSFDDGSFDNCSDVTLKVKRMTGVCNVTDLVYGEGIHFCCDDAGQDSIIVSLLVTDANGFTNSCMASVFVHDNEIPKIHCPTNGTVSCKFDYSDLSVFGTVRNSIDDIQNNYINDIENGGTHHFFGKDGYTTDNCTANAEELNPFISVDNCGEGRIVRRFRAKDEYGNYSSICTQTITIKDFRPFNPKHDLTWPRDYTLDGCLDENTHPDNLPSAYGWPVVTGDDKCSMIALDYDDLVFEHIEGMCYKILRKWRVVDWCKYEQNGNGHGVGYWEHVQTIMITDGVDPIVNSGCTPIDVNPLGNCLYRYHFKATGSDNCTDPNKLKWSYELKVNNSNNNVVTGDNDEFYLNLSKGTHKITWYVEDNCGNIGQCSKTFTVKDEKAPTPQCIEGLVTVLLPESGEITITAANFNRNSSDDCTKSNYGTCGCLTDLKFSFSKNKNEKTKVLTCANIENGIIDTIELEMWVTDESGNQDFCNTFIVLQDNSNTCPDILPPHDTSFYSLRGIVQNPDNVPVSNINIKLNNENAEFEEVSNTNENGEFVFNHLPDNSSFKLSSSKNGDDLNGVSTIDIVIIQKHLLGIKKFDSPYKYIAADVNNSNSVTASDILELRKLILGKVGGFSKNTSWKFLNKTHEFENNKKPYNFKQEIIVGKLTEDTNKDFYAIKIGDLNYSASNSNSNALEGRSTNEVVLVADNVDYKINDIVEMDFYSKELISTIGSQFTIEFNPKSLSFLNIENGLMSLDDVNINTSNKEKGIITVSWNNSTEINFTKDSKLFSIRFNAKNQSSLINNVKINSSLTKAEIYTVNSDNVEENDLKLEFRGIENYSFKVFQNVPNPFSSTTSIGFDIPYNQTVNLTVYDVTGKVLFATIKDSKKGHNEILLSQDEIKTTGLMYYKLEAGENTAIRKMILIK